MTVKSSDIIKSIDVAVEKSKKELEAQIGELKLMLKDVLNNHDILSGKVQSIVDTLANSTATPRRSKKAKEGEPAAEGGVAAPEKKKFPSSSFLWFKQVYTADPEGTGKKYFSDTQADWVAKASADVKATDPQKRQTQIATALWKTFIKSTPVVSAMIGADFDSAKKENEKQNSDVAKKEE